MPSVRRYFRPKEDITASELAYIYSNIVLNVSRPLIETGVMISDDDLLAMPENVRRHFEAPSDADER